MEHFKYYHEHDWQFVGFSEEDYPDEPEVQKGTFVCHCGLLKEVELEEEEHFKPQRPLMEQIEDLGKEAGTMKFTVCTCSDKYTNLCRVHTKHGKDCACENCKMFYGRVVKDQPKEEKHMEFKSCNCTKCLRERDLFWCEAQKELDKIRSEDQPLKAGDVVLSGDGKCEETGCKCGGAYKHDQPLTPKEHEHQWELGDLVTPNGWTPEYAFYVCSCGTYKKVDLERETN